jgi:predicted RNase H-like nuclease (RuvC/YqgF family)
MNKLLLVGIDPGTTVGYCIFDLNGNLIEINSKKNLPFSSLVSILIEFGIPLIVSCDKTPAPKFVQKLAVKLGSKLIKPEENISVKEKRELTIPFKEKIKNIHESDSLVAALFALDKIKPLLKKIENALKKRNKLELLDKVRETAIKQDLAISDIIEILTRPEQEVKIIKKAIEKREFSAKDFFNLYNKLKRSKKDIQFLKQQNQNLIQELAKKPKIKIPRQKTDEKILFKEITIQKLNNKLKEKQGNIEQLNNKISELNSYFAEINKNYLLKKLDNLSYSHFQSRNKLLNIEPGDILFVEDLTIHSEKTIKEVKNKVIIYKKATNKILQDLPFTFINSKNLNIKQTKLFAFVPKAQLDKELAKQDILSKIVKEYRESKSHHI